MQQWTRARFGRPNARLQELWDKDRITAVLQRYARGLDRFDEALIASAYHADGLDHQGDTAMTGAEFASYVLTVANADYKLTRHLLSNISIEVNGAIAFAETYYTAIHRLEREGRLVEVVIAGRYLDRFERRDGDWRIAHRYRVRDWSRIDPVGETVEPRPGWLLASRSTDDPSYALRASRG